MNEIENEYLWLFNKNIKCSKIRKQQRTAEETVSSLIGDSTTMKDRFSGGGGESACSSLLVEAAAPDDDDAGEPAASADETSALDAVRLMPFPLHATVVAECIYYNTLTSKLISSISFSITLSLSFSFIIFSLISSLL